MVKYLLFAIYFFTFSFYVNIQQDNMIISLSLFLCIFTFILLCYKSITQFDKIRVAKNQFVLIILMAIYMLYTLFIGYIYGMENFAIYKVLYNNVFVLLFIMLILFYNEYKKTFVMIRNMMCYSAIFVGLIGILMFLKDVSFISFSTHFPFIFLMDRASFSEAVGITEYRYQYTFTHKIRFGFYCVIMIYLFLKNKLLSNKLRITGVILMLINIGIANTVTTFVCALILLAHYIRKIRLNKYLIIVLNVITVGAFCLGIFTVIQYILQERNIFTLGNRLPIWEGIFKEIQKNPFGYVDAYFFHNFTYYKVPYIIGSAHNVFFQEAFDYGIIGGIIFLIIYLKYFYNLVNDRGILFLTITILFMIDAVLGKEGFPLFFLSYFLFDIDDQQIDRDKINNYNEQNRKIENIIP